MSGVAPGWFADPTMPGYLRWWDGYAWTAATHPIQQPPTYQHQPPIRPPVNPAADLAEERQLGRRAQIALIGGAVAYCVQFFVLALSYGQLFAEMRESWSQAGTDPYDPDAPLPGFEYFMLIELSSMVIGLALLVVAVMFLMWFYKAAVIAARAGLPATWEPVWAVVGFIIPVVQYWFPYQSARDTLPAGHPAGSIVKRWWTLWIAMAVTVVAVIVAAIFSTLAALAFAAIGAALSVAAAITARQMIDQINNAHAHLLAPAA